MSSLRPSLLALAALVVTTAACHRTRDDQSTRRVTANPACAAPVAVTAHSTRLAPHDANDFTFALYRAASCSSGDGDVVVSGFVTRHAVASLAVASADRVRIHERLGYEGPQPGREELARWQTVAHDVAFTGGGRIFPAASLTLSPVAAERATRELADTIVPLDFAHDRAEAAVAIGDFLREATGGQVAAGPGPDDLPKDTAVVVAAAFGLQAPWTTEFRTGMTNPAPFAREAGGDLMVPMMHRDDLLRYGEVAGSQILELPLGKEATSSLSMIVVLPPKGTPLASLERSLDRARYNAWDAALLTREVEVSLPRFEVHTKLDALPAITTLLGDAQLDTAALTRDGRSPKAVLVHEALVVVDEGGVKAAATARGYIATAADRPKPKQFRADRPFLFAIRDRASPGRPVLVLGRVLSPSAPRR